MLSIIVDTSQLDRHVNELMDFVKVETVPIFHAVAKERITENTFQGRDWQGKNFVPYTYHYALQRKGMGLSGSPVDLSISGGMIGSIDLRNGVTSVSNEEMEKAAKLEEGKSPLAGPREFIGINEEGLAECLEVTQKEITNKFSDYGQS